MGGKDHCCVINCTSGRRKARNNAEQLSFSSFPMGNGNKAKHHRVLWLGAVRRKDFVVPTKNSKVCGLHFVSDIAITNPESVDYVPSVKVGYEKHVSARETQTSKRAKCWSVTLLGLSVGMAGDKWVGLSLLILVRKWRLEVWKNHEVACFYSGSGTHFITTTDTKILIIVVFSLSATPLFLAP